MWKSMMFCSCLIFLLQIHFCAGENAKTEVSNNLCPPWSYFDSAKQECNHTIYYAVSFLNNRTLLRVGYCSTYDEDTGIVSFAPCPYFQTDNFIVHGSKFNIWYIQLPNNISELNDYMCGRMKRKGKVCSECMDGFGPAVTSVGFNIQCSNCTNVWYGIPLFLFLEFVPVTIFYFIILVFQINFTSAPMTCFIMYSQLVALWWSFAFDGEDYNVSRQMFILNNSTEWIRKILITLYDIWNLRFFHFLVPPFCISNSLKPFHVGLLGYISILYPICLIILTWICIELHDRNFRLLVWLLRPFQACLVRLRGRWNRKNDIIDVFSSFFLLSFSKVMYQADLFISYQTIRDKHFNDLGTLLRKYYVTNCDLTVTFGSSEHLIYAVPAGIFTLAFNTLPTLILLLYPLKVFRRCLSACRLDGLALKYFVERFTACYRDGYHSFAALYFILRPILFISSSVLSHFSIADMDPYLSRNTVLSVAALMIALCRPYKNAYMNVLDSIFLIYFGLFCHLISSYQGFYTEHATFVFTFEVVLLLPLVAFVLFISLRAIYKTKAASFLLQKCRLIWSRMSSKLQSCLLLCRGDISTNECDASVSVEQRLIEPINAEDIASYGAMD